MAAGSELRLSPDLLVMGCNVFYNLNTGPTWIKPAELIAALGIEYKEWEAQPISDQIKLHFVNPETLPRPLPPFLRIEFFQIIEAAGKTGAIPEH